MLAPATQSTRQGAVGLETVISGANSFVTTPRCRPRSSSLAIPGKRNGELWTFPSGERSRLPARPAFG